MGRSTQRRPRTDCGHQPLWTGSEAEQPHTISFSALSLDFASILAYMLLSMPYCMLRSMVAFALAMVAFAKARLVAAPIFVQRGVRHSLGAQWRDGYFLSHCS